VAANHRYSFSTESTKTSLLQKNLLYFAAILGTVNFLDKPQNYMLSFAIQLIMVQPIRTKVQAWFRGQGLGSGGSTVP